MKIYNINTEDKKIMWEGGGKRNQGKLVFMVSRLHFFLHSVTFLPCASIPSNIP